MPLKAQLAFCKGANTFAYAYTAADVNTAAALHKQHTRMLMRILMLMLMRILMHAYADAHADACSCRCILMQMYAYADEFADRACFASKQQRYDDLTNIQNR